ncbi:MAG: tetratricopeptide repeat protein [Verrucomicrobia bacterium]|nr:tetratricopeptide repeat protein [Verrucomicrobiota bacterium]
MKGPVLARVLRSVIPGVGFFALLFCLNGCSEKADTLPDLAVSYVAPVESVVPNSKLQITYPLDEALFPPEIIAPTFLWEDKTPSVDRWILSFQTPTSLQRILCSEPSWRPDRETWEEMKKISVDNPLSITLTGYSSKHKATALSGSAVRISTSTDEVGAPIFFREVILPFLDAVIDPSKIRWRFGSIDQEEQPPIVLEGLPVCGNCHSFSQDGSLLAMDVDYANSKASYVITRTQEEMKLNTSDIITWNEFRKEDREQTYGLLSQISPDGRYVLSTVKDKSVFVPIEDLYYSQLFFPIKGIIACYDRVEEKYTALKGADDPKYVQSNPTWSPDGKTILFARTVAYDLQNTQGQGKTLLTREECKEFVEDGKPFKFKIYKVDFNDGQGGEATPLEGASEEGVSNYFPKYSPDGKWVVFCKASDYMLLRGDSRLYIMPAQGGEPRLMRCNTDQMNSWHSWSPNGKWLVFSSKANGPYTQLWLTHIDVNGESTPPVVLAHFTGPDRAANIPEFVNRTPNAIRKITPEFLNDLSWCRAGDEYFRNHKPQDALTNYLYALTINPDCYQAHQKIGFLYFNVFDRLQEGITHMEKALKIEPRYAMTHFDYGMACLHMKKYKVAKAHIAEAIRLIPRGIDKQYDAAEMRFQLARTILLDGEPSEAAPHLESALQINPDHPEANYLRALLYISSDDVPKAIPLMQKAISANPKVDRNPEMHARVGAYYAENKQYSQALSEAERALSLAQEQNNAGLVDELLQVIPQLRNLAARE